MSPSYLTPTSTTPKSCNLNPSTRSTVTPATTSASTPSSTVTTFSSPKPTPKSNT